jgi:hypothetical protein
MRKQRSRTGETKITSVSISNEFMELIDKHNLSPTEAIRRGIAVMLYDLGVSAYQTNLNFMRKEYVEEFFKEFNKNQEKIEVFNKFVDLSKDIIELNNKMGGIKEEDGIRDKG